jgi:dTDP-4-dehydrorhamnose reductase
VKFAVIGAAGQLGRDLCPRLSGEVTPLTRETLDVTRPETVSKALGELNPDIVINCSAYNFVDKGESEPEAAFAVNAWGVQTLAKWCRDHDRTLVHYSTDYVFGLEESRKTPYAETDAPGPVSAYGLSKLAGEYLVRSVCPKHLVIRTCGLYGVWGSGGKGGNFVETMLRGAAQGKALRVVADQVCAPSYTVDVAQGTVDLIRNGCQGLVHLTSAGATSWYEFAAVIFRLSNVQANFSPTTSREFGAAARRPPYSILAPAALTAAGLSPLRHWSEALPAYLAERKRK